MSRNSSTRDYMRDAASVGCVLCVHLGLGETPAELHHPRTGVGAARRAPDSAVISLCTEHHRGNSGVHGMGRKAFERHYGVTEAELTVATQRAVEALRRRRV